MRFLIAIAAITLAATANATQSLPDWWPEGVPVHSESVIERVDHALERGLPDVRFDFEETAIDTADVIDFYAEAMHASGWKVGKLRVTDGLSRSFTADHLDQNRRVIVTAFEPDSVFNRNPFVRVKVTVYREIP